MAIKLSDHFTYGRLVRFALPSIAMMIFTSIYSVVDGLFVSNFAGKEALAVVPAGHGAGFRRIHAGHGRRRPGGEDDGRRRCRAGEPSVLVHNDRGGGGGRRLDRGRRRSARAGAAPFGRSGQSFRARPSVRAHPVGGVAPVHRAERVPELLHRGGEAAGGLRGDGRSGCDEHRAGLPVHRRFGLGG